MTSFLIILAGAYLAGSVNFAILLFAFLGKGDPRSRFSGNAGTVNVGRQAGAGWAALVLLLDLARAAAVAWAALSFLPGGQAPWAGLALVLGNSYPCFHGFRGGKGVAAYLGFTIPIAPLAALLSALVWGGVYGLTRLPFAASFGMVAVLAAGTVTASAWDPAASAATVLTALWIYGRHQRNVKEFFMPK